MDNVTETPADSPAPEPLLDSVEERVLGSLMEKAATTPDNYPLSLNALTNACNQKSNRHPVVEFDDKMGGAERRFGIAIGVREDSGFGRESCVEFARRRAGIESAEGVEAQRHRDHHQREHHQRDQYRGLHRHYQHLAFRFL